MKTTTDPSHWKFIFTITDLGKLLGKSPVTLRGWEKSGLITIPKEASGERKINTRQVQKITQIAYESKRITKERRDLVAASMTMFQIIERTNEK